MANPPLPPVPTPNPQQSAPIPAAPPPAPLNPALTPAQPAPPANMQRQPTIDERPGEHVETVPLSFWQKPFVQDVLPFVTALVIHVGLIALGLITAKTVQTIIYATREPVIIPDATIIEGAPVGGIPHPGLGGDPTRDAAQEQFPTPIDPGLAENPSSNLTDALSGEAGGAEDPTMAAGPNPGAFGSGGNRIGPGTGDGGGNLAPLGMAGGGGGLGPKSPFMGVSGNAMKVAYVSDSSGSMLGLFDTLRVEMRKAVDTLVNAQQFNIIFFSEDGFQALDKQGLLLATPENKRKAYEFLDRLTPHGSSNPMAGIRLAFQNQPQLIYILTDGEFEMDNNVIMEEIRKLNVGRKVKINTIAFGDDPDQNYHKFLDQIAKENGGVFRHVRESDLRQQQQQ